MESGWLERLGYLFYAVSPSRTSFANVEDVPNYYDKVLPYLVLIVILENLVASLKKRSTARFNDGIGSVSQGMLQQLAKVLAKGTEFSAYIYVYNNWRIATLPWNSRWTWFLGFLAVDLTYYWVHRATHEINILWAAHQVHHSSEDLNISTAFRLSVTHDFLVWVFYIPLAFLIPPSVFIVHTQLNLLYQFWIHTKVIGTLGRLEYILNTPSHHRVHHGRNRYCIDKNYAGVLIIWDRIFGTFEAESKEVVYGLTHPINTFSPLSLQFGHYNHIFKSFLKAEGFRNKFSVLFKGPGWSPGKPRLGLREDIPDVQSPVAKYHCKLPIWLNIYICLHFVLITVGYEEVTERHGNMPQMSMLAAVAFEIFSLITIGAMLDGRKYAPLLEFIRCLVFLLGDYYYYLPAAQIDQLPNIAKLMFQDFVKTCFSLSALLWMLFCARMVSKHFHKRKTA